jgi:hypothetical protein
MIFKMEYWRNMGFSRWCSRTRKEYFVDCLTLNMKVVPRTFETSVITSPTFLYKVYLGLQLVLKFSTANRQKLHNPQGGRDC